MVSCEGCQNQCWRSSTVCTKTSILVYFEDDNDPPPGGSGGGGGGSSGGPGPTGQVPCNPTPEINNGLLPCPRGNTSGWMPVIIPEEDPCIVLQNAAKKMDSLYIRGKVDSMLNTMYGWQDYSFEKGFPIYKTFSQNTDGTFNISNYYPGAVQNGGNMGVNISFTLPASTKAASQTHIHTDSGFAAPSVGDIFSLIETHLNLDTQDTKLQYEGNLIVAFDGSKYAISVTDSLSAAQFYSTKFQNLDLNSNDWKETSDIKVKFYEAYDYFLGIYDGFPEMARVDRANEMAQASVLRQFNSGVTLFKKDTLGNFKPIVVKTVNDPNSPRRFIYIQDCL